LVAKWLTLTEKTQRCFLCYFITLPLFSSTECCIEYCSLNRLQQWIWQWCLWHSRRLRGRWARLDCYESVL